MTDMDKLVTLKVLSAIADTDTTQDTALTVYLNMAANKVIARAYPFDSTVTTVPDRYGFLQCRIAAYLWDKRGADGETSHTEPGVTRTYENGDVPESMLSEIVPQVATTG